MGSGDILRHLRPNDVLVAAQVLGEPTALLEELFARCAAPGAPPGMRLFVGMGLTDVLSRKPEDLRAVTTVGMGANGTMIGEGRMDLLPCHMSHLPWLLSTGPLSTDVALVQTSPPDADGWCSLGLVSDYAWHAVRAARVVLAEINEAVPVIAGDTRVHLSQITHSVRTNRPLPSYRTEEPGALETEIGRNVARFVRDGSCLQIGIGKIGEAVLCSLGDRRDLGVHSGMIGESLLELMRQGVVTNARKAVDTGLAVAGSVLGSARALTLAAEEPSLRLRAIEHTHSPAVIEAISDVVCVNSALEVDLLGQVNSETAGGRYVGAVGGSVDFLRASLRSPGGRSVVALPSRTGRGRSRIVPAVERVTALGSDVDVIATEHGYAEIRGTSPGERARRIAGIAHPDDRPALLAAAAGL